MIPKLPVLPSDFRKWSWTKSNGTASDAQTERAYNAITNRGLCSDFSHAVWNDLAKTVSDVLQQAGIVWDSTYGSYESCIMTTADMILTANKFNAVALNIHRFGFITWQWAVNSDVEGYVGRDQFYGYSTHKENADNVYGWYFIQLTHWLNELISVLKDEADFSEFEALCPARSSYSALLGTVRLLPLASAEKETLSSIAGLISDLAQILSVSAIAHSFNNGVLVPAPATAICGKSRSLSEVLAELRTYRSAPLAIIIRSDGIVNASANASHSAAAAAIIKCPAIYNAFAVSCHSANMSRVSQILVIDSGHINAARSAAGEAKLTARSEQESQISALREASMAAQAESASDGKGTIQINLPILAESAVISYDRPFGSIDVQISAALSGAEKIGSADKATVSVKKIAHLDSICTSSTRVLGSLELDHIVSEWIYPIQNGDDLYIQQAFKTTVNSGTLEVI